MVVYVAQRIHQIDAEIYPSPGGCRKEPFLNGN
jgi:hypothetical protein